MTDIWIVIVNFNGWADTLRCVLGLRDAAHPVVVVDNASDQDESASLVEFGCHLLRLPRNTGFAGG